MRAERFRKEELAYQEQLRKEELDRQEARLLKETEERIAMCKLQETELRIRQEQWDWQKTRDLRDAERKRTPAAQVKFFGDVLKNVMPKFPFDAAEIPTFFEGVEKLFDSFEVPNELRSKLLLPYLNDKSKSLLLRLTQSQQESYDEVKRFILAEIKLTPLQFKQRFERATKNRDETYTLYCSRLKNLLTYYCNGRDVKRDFDTLFSLLIADKIKSALPEACINHILAAEGDGWMKCDELSNALDIYFANHTYEGRPKFERNEPRTKPGNVSNKDYRSNNERSADGNANRSQTGSVTATQPSVNRAAANDRREVSQNTPRNGLCYLCHSPNHKQRNCPQRNVQSRNGGTQVTTRNFACAVQLPATEQVEVLSVPTVSRSPGNMPPSESVTNTSVTRRPPPVVATAVAPTANPSQGGVNATPVPQVQSAHVAITEPTEEHVVPVLAKLKYVPITITGIADTYNALIDGGSQINLVRSDVLQQVSQPITAAGRIKIKGVVGPPVETDLVMLELNPAPSDASCRNIAPPLREIFAVAPDLNEQVILTADAVQRLDALSEYESVVCDAECKDAVTNTASADVETTDETTTSGNSALNSTALDLPDEGRHYENDVRRADTVTLLHEQMNDLALKKYFDIAQ